MGEGFEQTLWGFHIHFSPPKPKVIIINDFEEEEQVEKKTTKHTQKLNNLLKLNNQQMFW
jgi:hypothetical protein